MRGRVAVERVTEKLIKINFGGKKRVGSTGNHNVESRMALARTVS